MTGEDSYLNDRKARVEALENDSRMHVLGGIVESRRTNANAEDNKNSGSNAVASAMHPEAFTAIENEWKRRKDQMMKSRAKIAELGHEKISKLSLSSQN